MANITDWNILPNIRYYVRLEESGGSCRISLYTTQAAAEAGSSSNRVANGSTSLPASDTEVTLTDESTNPRILKFNTNESYHLKVTFTAGEPTVVFRVGPMYDLEITDPLCASDVQQRARATLEIDKGTHSVITKQFAMIHSPSRIDGDVVRLNTTEYPSEDNMVEEVEISYRLGEGLVDILSIYRYEDLYL